MPEMRTFIGLDLGQSQDFTALAILQRPQITPTTPPQDLRPPYTLAHLKRFPLGTPYPQIVSDMAELLQTPELAPAPSAPPPALVVDGTGVGRAVLDLLRDSLRGRVTCKLWPVIITAGHSITMPPGGGIGIPKKELVAAMIVLLQGRRLKASETLSEVRTLMSELSHFKAKVSLAGNESFEAWRERDHDDLVLAVALAAWRGESELPPLGVGPPRPLVTRLRA